MVAFGGLILVGMIGWDSFSGIWLVFIGFFLSSAARSAEAEAAFSDRIEHLRVSDVMDAEPVAIPERAEARPRRGRVLPALRLAWFPVVDTGGQLVGVVTREASRGAGGGPRAAARSRR